MGSPYRAAPAPPPLRAVFRGKDDARWPLAGWLLLAAPFAPLAGRVGLPPVAAALALFLLGIAIHFADRPTRRFELRVGPDGYRLRRYRFGVLPTGSFRVSLEWEPSFTDRWDDYDPAGLSFAPPRRLLVSRRGLTTDPPSFGPVDDIPEVRALVEDIRSAAAHFRKVVSASDVRRERRRRSGDVARLWDRVDPGSVIHGPWGRARSMRLARGATLDGLRLPPGTTLEFGFADDWQAPSTPDLITRVTLGGPAVWDALSTTLCRGATIALDERRRIRTVTRGFEGRTQVRGVTVDGSAPLDFDDRGRLTSCVLGTPVLWGPLFLPAGTRVTRLLDWAIRMEGPGLAVPDVPEARPTSAQARLTPRGGRATLAELLRDPRGRVMPEVQLCEHATGAPQGGRTHRTVKL